MIEELYYDAVKLRKELHKNAEVSDNEYKTREILMNYLSEIPSAEVHDMGKWFYVMRKADIETDDTIAFRADFDAVKISDDNVGHYCGHDGHSATLAGFMKMIDSLKIKRNVYAVFENAEETGKGAMDCSRYLNSVGVDEVYGYHNIPSVPKGTVLIKHGTFACASNGLIIRFKGAPSHAAYPESGRNPSYAIGRMISLVEEISREKKDYIEFITVVGVSLGDKSFGVSCGSGEIYLTLRSEVEESLNMLNQKMIDEAFKLSDEYELEMSYEFIEPFPETRNNDECVERIANAASNVGCMIKHIDEPYHWSEDFGHFLKLNKGAFFGVGNGEDSCDLHTSGYEFCDAIMPVVWKLYYSLINR